MDRDRVSPKAIEAERSLLGGLLQSPDRLPQVSERVDVEDFYRTDHAALYGLLRDMAGRGETIDLVTVPERIGREGQHERYGGVSYVLQLPDQVPSTANLPVYADVIRNKAILRRLIDVTTTLADRAYDQPIDLGELLSEAVLKVNQVGESHDRRSWEPISTILDREFVRIEKLDEVDGSTTGYTTGFSELDGKLAGLQRTDLLVLAARPGMGKTALALNIAQNVAVIEGKPVGIFSLEMGRGQLVTRMLCCHAEVNAGRVRTGNLETDDWSKLIESTEILRGAPVHIDDTPGLSIGELQTRARKLHAEHGGLALLVIDYLQLMKGDEPRASREQQISAISRGLKGLAKTLDCPVMALSQLNRGVESRADKRPLVSDLRESGAIEQDADVILFIYRDEYYNPETAEKGLAEVIIAKQRNGPTGKVKLAFRGQFTRFDNWLEDDLDFP